MTYVVDAPLNPNKQTNRININKYRAKLKVNKADRKEKHKPMKYNAKKSFT